jgi:hypothetical protein
MSDISDKVVSLSVNYLGPASKVFMARQTQAHMNGLAFEALERNHLLELSKWVLISASLVVDKEKAKELADKIVKL